MTADAREAVLAEQRMRWRSGAGDLAEVFLERHPDLRCDADFVLDLIYNELLLRRERGEQPTLEEYQRRFPAQTEPLRLLFEVDGHLEERPISPGQTTLVATPPPAAPTPRPNLVQPLVAGDSSRGSSELDAVLQRRLRFMSIVTGLLYVQSGWQLRTFWHIDDWPLYRTHMAIVWSTLALNIAFAAFFLLVRRRVPLPALRTIELAIVGAPLLQLTAVLVDMTWLQGDLLRYLQQGGHDPGYLFNSIVLFYFPLIVCYGILVPNTGRRCLVVALAIAVLPIIVLFGGLPTTPAIWNSHRTAFLEGTAWVAMWMAVAVACSVYGCHRINVLQREALVARRLGQYRLRERLGSGGMGEVYLAEHVLLKQPCAVKIIRPERAGDPAAMRRFEREVQATARLKHWNTVTIFDYGTAADGTFYYVMEYLPGLNLEDMVRRCGPLPAARVCHFLRQACAALHEAHAIGLIHRDIKPANLMVCERGGVHDVVKVLDFGLVRDVEAGGERATVTAAGIVAGTPAYMSPEQAAAAPDLDARSDIYSLGAVAYFLLTGQPPFANRTPMQVLAAHLYEAPRPIRELNDSVPEALAAVVMRCLLKKPNERFADIAALDAAVRETALDERWTATDAAAWWRLHEPATATQIL